MGHVGGRDDGDLDVALGIDAAVLEEAAEQHVVGRKGVDDCEAELAGCECG